jgi:hypothetical protein
MRIVDARGQWSRPASGIGSSPALRAEELRKLASQQKPKGAHPSWSSKLRVVTSEIVILFRFESELAATFAIRIAGAFEMASGHTQCSGS